MIDMLIRSPVGYTTTLPANPTVTEQAVHDALMSISAEWQGIVGTDGVDNIYYVITLCSDLAVIEGMIAAYGVPIEVLHAQESQQTPAVDANGLPVLDVDNMPVMETVVHKPLAVSLLPYMPEIPTADANMNVTGSTPASVVSIRAYGGHAAIVGLF